MVPSEPSELESTQQELHQLLTGDAEADPVQIVSLLRKEKLDDPERLAALLVQEQRRESVHRSAVRRIDPMAVRRLKPQPPSDEPIVHKSPTIPCSVNGIGVTADELASYNGTPLHYVLVPYSAAERILVAFDEPLPIEEMHLETRRRVAAASVIDPAVVAKADATTAARRAGLPQLAEGQSAPENSLDRSSAMDFFDPGAGPWAVGGGCGYMGASPCVPPPDLTDEAQFFDDAGYSGNWFWLKPGYEYPDLTRLRLEHGIFSGGRSWNDEISSVRAGYGYSYVQFFEHINFGGSSLTLGSHESVENLTALGWNDRVSSVRHIHL